MLLWFFLNRKQGRKFVDGGTKVNESRGELLWNKGDGLLKCSKKCDFIRQIKGTEVFRLYYEVRGDETFIEL